MVWLPFSHIFSTILELVHIGRLSGKDKDLEILVLRHQLDVMTRLQSKPVKPNRAEKLTLAVLTKKLKQSTNHSSRQLRDIIRIIKPETVIRWHRELVRRKWIQEQKIKGGRPRISQEIESLIVRLAQENNRRRITQTRPKGFHINCSQCARQEWHCASPSSLRFHRLATAHESLQRTAVGL